MLEKGTNDMLTQILDETHPDAAKCLELYFKENREGLIIGQPRTGGIVRVITPDNEVFITISDSHAVLAVFGQRNGMWASLDEVPTRILDASETW